MPGMPDRLTRIRSSTLEIGKKPGLVIDKASPFCYNVYNFIPKGYEEKE